MVKEKTKQVVFVTLVTVLPYVAFPIVLLFSFILTIEMGLEEVLVTSYNSDRYQINVYKKNYGATTSTTFNFFLIDRAEFFEMEHYIYSTESKSRDVLFTKIRNDTEVVRFTDGMGEVRFFDLENRSFVKLGLEEEFKILFGNDSILNPTAQQLLHSHDSVK